MNQIVKLQVYEGKLAKNEDGTWITQNHAYKVRYGSKEWELLKVNGGKMFSKIEVIEVLEEKITFGEKEVKGKKVPTQKHDYVPVEIKQSLLEEVAAILKPKAEKTEKEMIAELNAKIEALTSAQAVAPAIEAPVKPSATVEAPNEVQSNGADQGQDAEDETLEQLQEKYEVLAGKKPNQLWKERRLLTEIESMLSK